MNDPITRKLEELNIKLPPAAPPAASYLPWLQSGNLVFISGQLPMDEGKIKYAGKVGVDVTPDEGIAAARLCALNAFSQLREATGGDFSKVRRCVRLGGFVNAPADFDKHPAIVNGASEAVLEIMGEPGRHARVAVGVSNLPFNAAVELEALFEVS
ncbi:MAG: RidA family protein [Hyphomicrobiales bacterium]|nr:RidA family protein [Hyphomicrobiales bacterium]MCY4049099.1 RidA family protein [Hyphomicrobiales bacterium]